MSTFVTAVVNANSAPLLLLHVSNGYPYKTIVSVNLAPQLLIGGGGGLGGGLSTLTFVAVGAPNDTPNFTHNAIHTTMVRRIPTSRHRIEQTRLIYCIAIAY